MKAEEHVRTHPQWPVLHLPRLIGGALGLSPAEIEQLQLINLLFFCYADVTDDAEDADLSPAWEEWGWPQAVNAGNRFLFGCLYQVGRFFEAGHALRLLESYTFAGLRMTEGQQIDLGNQFPVQTSYEDYLGSIQGKTGASFSAFCAAPAILADRSNQEVERFAEYGEALGTLIQLISDVREAWQTPAGPDLRNGKLSLPFYCAQELLPSVEAEALLETLRRIQAGSREAVRPLLDRPEIRTLIEFRLELVRQRARKALASVPMEDFLRVSLGELLDIPAFVSMVPMI